MFSGETIGLIGGIIGGVVGLAGGIFGTWMSIRGTIPGAQRIFMIKACIIGWIGIVAFLAILLFAPTPWSWIVWIVYAPALVFSILYVNRTLQSLADRKITES
jgi:hypothetical protein